MSLMFMFIAGVYYRSEQYFPMVMMLSLSMVVYSIESAPEKKPQSRKK